MRAFSIDDVHLRVEAVGRCILLFTARSDKRAIVLSTDEAEKLSLDLRIAISLSRYALADKGADLRKKKPAPR